MDIKFSGFAAPGLGRIKPVSGVTPFTYHDGATYLEILSKMEEYIKKDLVPGVNQEFDNFLGNLNGFIEEMENGLSVDRDKLQAVFDEFTSLVTSDLAKVTDKVDLINNKTGPADIQRITLTTPTRELVLNPAWPNNQPVEFVVTQDATGNRKLTFPANVRAAITLDPAPGAVTLFTMVPEGGGKWFAYQSFSTVSGGVTDTVNTALLENPKSGFYAALTEKIVEDVPDLATDTVLSELAKWDSRIFDSVWNAANQKFHPKLRKWNDLVNRSTDTANPAMASLLILGSSTALGMNAFNTSYGWASRIGDYLGSKETAPIGLLGSFTRNTSGVQVFSGAMGGVKSSAYVPDTFLNPITRAKPDVVIHMVGSNDYAENIALDVYRNNLLMAIQRINTASPGAVHILIHQQSRIDVSNPANSWESYGTVMEAVAREHGHLYLNADAHFRQRGLTPKGDRAGLLADPVHMGNSGHRVMADLVAEFMGHPIVYAGDETYMAGSYAGGTFGNTGYVDYAYNLIPSRPYPRHLNVFVSAYGSPGDVASEIKLVAYAGETGTVGLPGKNVIMRVDPSHPEGHTWNGHAHYYVPANTAAQVRLQHNGNKYLTSDAQYSTLMSTLTPL